jgi:hypothetical protein
MGGGSGGGMGMTGGGSVGGGGGVFDAGPVDPPGCFKGNAQTAQQLATACSWSSYQKFDNCVRAGLFCDGGLLEPAVMKQTDGGGAAATAPYDAGPMDNCYDPSANPPRSQVVFMTGSTNFTPFIKAMVPILASSSYTIIWQPTSSCTGVDTAFNNDPTKRVMKNPANTGTVWPSYYNVANPNGTQCQLGTSPSSPGAGQEYVDVGESDIYSTSCPVTSPTSPFDQYIPGSASYPGVRHYTGAIQVMSFAVPKSSTQTVLSAEAGRLVYGLGGNDPTSGAPLVMPWNDPQFIWKRSATTGTAGITARGLGVAATDLWGVDQRTAGNMASQLLGANNQTYAEKTIGMLSMDVGQTNKTNLTLMYFQARGALAGYLPDLKPATTDKENVRDGHYPLWGPIHLYTREIAPQTLTAGAQAFVSQFSVPEPDTGLLDAIVNTANVPPCAMRVNRSSEMGPLAPYSPPFQCMCYFAKKVGGLDACKACQSAGDCTDPNRPACNLGYCEVQ